jgi:hypothetical protein
MVSLYLMLPPDRTVVNETPDINKLLNGYKEKKPLHKKPILKIVLRT